MLNGPGLGHSCLLSYYPTGNGTLYIVRKVVFTEVILLKKCCQTKVTHVEYILSSMTMPSGEGDNIRQCELLAYRWKKKNKVES